MKNHEALRELRDLVKLPDSDEFHRYKLRSQQLEDWIDRWLVEVEFNQAVVDVRYLTSEFNDSIKLKLAQSIAEDIAENCATYVTSDRNISSTMLAFRRKSI